MADILKMADGKFYGASGQTGDTYESVGGKAGGSYLEGTVGQANRVTTPGAPTVASMTLADAQKEANKAFSGLVAPMTLEQIRAREAEAKANTLETATSIYDPSISREKQVGGAQVSTAEGVVGQRQGFNLSTAEQAFVADVQNKVQDRVREVENIKASYISQGNLAAADRADAQLQALNEWNSEMTIAKANYALQIMAGNRDEARLGLERDKVALDEKRFGLEEQSLELEKQAQTFNQGMAEKNLAVSIAGLTGEYEGSPTFAAKQAEIQKILAEADLTGFYNGKETLAAATAKANQALAEKGYLLDEKQLAETIRSNKAQEGLAAQRNAISASSGASSKVVKTPTDVMNETVSRLTNLRNSGTLNDANYQAEIRVLGAALGYEADSLGSLESMVNKAMEGDSSSKEWLANQANQAHGSDFVIETPKASASTQAGKAVQNFLTRGGILPELTSAVLKAGTASNNFLKGLVGGREITTAERDEVIRMFGGK